MGGGGGGGEGEGEVLSKRSDGLGGMGGRPVLAVLLGPLLRGTPPSIGREGERERESGERE